VCKTNHKDKCAVKLAKMLLCQPDLPSFRNAMVETNPANVDSDVKAILQWIKVCEEDKDYFMNMKEGFISRHMSMEPSGAPRHLERLPELNEDEIGVQSD
jgi:hypothetical protein